MKRSLFSLLLLIMFSALANANDRYLYPGEPVFGVVGCSLEGTVKFADIRNGGVQLPTDGLLGESCLEVLADLSQPANVKVGSAVAARMNGTVPATIEEFLVFPTGAGDQAAEIGPFPVEDVFSIRGRGTTALVACELTEDGWLSVVFADGFEQQPGPGDSCTDILYKRRATGRRVGQPVGALLRGIGPQETQVEECLIFDIGGAGLSAREDSPSAQLICDYSADAENLVVKSFRALPGIYDGEEVSEGESCATAYKIIEAVIQPPISVRAYDSTEDKTLVYPIASANLWQTP